MTAWPWLDLVLLIGAAAFALAMVWLIWSSLFGDRPRKRGEVRIRCPACWYDMAGSPTLRCSECGHWARSEKDLRRTRRRWGRAALAFTSLLLGTLWVGQRAGTAGWATMMPSGLLIAAIPLADDPSGSLYQELGSRLQRSQLSPSQINSIFSRFIEGDWWASPVDSQWREKYGLLIRAWRNSPVVPDKVKQRLRQLPPAVELSSRELWPPGLSPAVEVKVEDWWPQGAECRITLSPQGEDGAGAPIPPVVLRRAPVTRFADTTFFLPPLKHSTREAVIDAVVERRWTPGEPWEKVGFQRIILPMRMSAAAPLPQPVSDPFMDSEMQGVFAGRIVRWSSGASPIRFRYQPDRTMQPLFNDTAIGVSVELVRDDGAVARRLRMWWRGGAGPLERQRQMGAELPFEDAALLKQVNEFDGRWSLRVRSDPALAMRVEGPSTFWEGEFTVPVIIDDNGRAAPPPPWSSEPGDADDELSQ